MRIEPEISTASIRMRGNFNPAIFTPDWIARTDLVGEKVGVAVELKVVHPEVSVLECEWFSLRVTKQLFQIDTNDAPFIRIADLTGRMFGNVLLHTPIWHLVIARSVHFSAGTEAVQHQIGRTLAPLEPWGWWGKEIEGGSQRGGLGSLAMEARVEEAPIRHSTQAVVQPSAKVRPGIGVFVEVEDRFTLPSEEKTIGSLEIIAKLSAYFEKSVKHSESIIDQIMSLKGRFDERNR
jgi:hypothetical protein